MKLPKDLKKFARRSAWRRILFFAGLSVGFCMFLYVCFSNGKRDMDDWVQVSGYGAALLVAGLISGFPWKITDRTYYGTVVKRKYRVEFETQKIQTIHLEKTSNNICRFTVQLPGGKRMRGSMRDEAVSYTGKARFAVGDTVFHLFGAPVTVRLSDAPEASVYCAVCGEENKEPGKQCHYCGHTLITSLADIGAEEKNRMRMKP